jgi:transposase
METATATSDELKNYIVCLEKEKEQLQENNQNTVISYEKKVAEFERNNKTLEQKNEELELKNRLLEEKLKLALYRQFGRHAEKFVGEGQPPLFDAGEATAPTSPKPTDESETVKSYNRTKRGRKPLDERIPRIDEVIDITEEEKQCACGSALTCIGEEVTERVVIVPEKVYVLRSHTMKYACHECEGSGDEDRPAVRTGKAPANIIPGSIATPELLSYVFTKKYCDYVPFYRQETAFERIGVSLSRQNMANWQQKVCEAVQPLLNLIKEHLRSGNVAQMDETTMTVLDEPGRENSRKSYMWLARGGPPGKPALWYEYRETGEQKHTGEIPGGFSGYPQSDGYRSYESAAEQDLTGVIHVGCRAHTRR